MTSKKAKLHHGILYEMRSEVLKQFKQRKEMGEMNHQQLTTDQASLTQKGSISIMCILST